MATLCYGAPPRDETDRGGSAWCASSPQKNGEGRAIHHETEIEVAFLGHRAALVSYLAVARNVPE